VHAWCVPRVFINLCVCVCVDRPFAAIQCYDWTLHQIDANFVSQRGPFWNVLTLPRRVRRRRRRIFPWSPALPVSPSWSPLCGAAVVSGRHAVPISLQPLAFVHFERSDSYEAHFSPVSAGGSVGSFIEPSSDKPVVQDAAAWKKCWNKNFLKKKKKRNWKRGNQKACSSTAAVSTIAVVFSFVLYLDFYRSSPNFFRATLRRPPTCRCTLQRKFGFLLPNPSRAHNKMHHDDSVARSTWMDPFGTDDGNRNITIQEFGSGYFRFQCRCFHSRTCNLRNAGNSGRVGDCCLLATLTVQSRCCSLVLVPIRY